MNKMSALILGIILIVTGPVFAQQSTQTEQSSKKTVDVGNKICPVSGRTIGLMGPGVQEIYNGKIYHLCCGGCVARFESDPGKYSKIAEAQSAS